MKKKLQHSWLTQNECTFAYLKSQCTSETAYFQYNKEHKASHLHFVQADLFFTESTSLRSTLALCFQVLRKISFFHQHATLRMYTGKFDKLTAVSVGLLKKGENVTVIQSINQLITLYSQYNFIKNALTSSELFTKQSLRESTLKLKIYYIY